jgi:hypothetical protein
MPKHSINNHRLELVPAPQWIQFSPQPVTVVRHLSDGSTVDFPATLCLLSQTVKIGEVNHKIKR